MIFRLPVFLNGSRSYVQGTQMLARTAGLVEQQFAQNAVLKSAAFHRITDRVVEVRITERKEEQPQEIAEAVFEAGDKRRYYASYKEVTEVAPQDDVPPECEYNQITENPENPLDGKWSVTGISSLEDALVAIVQTVKAQHEHIGDNVANIWFTGLRAAALPVSIPAPDVECLLEISHLRTMGGSGRFQSLQRVSLTGLPAGELSAAVSFAYQREES